MPGTKMGLYPTLEPNHQYLMAEPVSLGCGELQELTQRSAHGDYPRTAIEGKEMLVQAGVSQR